MAKTYLHGKPVEGVIEVHEHVSPAINYVKVLAALFVLTGLTYAVSFANLGPASLPVAMTVAFIKATLVSMYFMHLRYDDRYHVFVFLSTIIFVAIFFTFTMFDLTSRPRLNEEQETFFRVEQGGDWNDAQRATNIDKYGPAQEGKAPAPDAKTDAKADGKADGKGGNMGAGDVKAGNVKPDPRKEADVKADGKQNPD
jgi:caa(3)-type oxidase subunit IV